MKDKAYRLACGIDELLHKALDGMKESNPLYQYLYEAHIDIHDLCFELKTKQQDKNND